MTDVYATATTVKNTHFTGYTYGSSTFSGSPNAWPTIPNNDKIDCVYFTWAVLHKVMIDEGKTPSSKQRSAIYISNWKTQQNLTLHSAVEQGLKGIQGPVTAIVDEGLGDNISISDIKKGDFVQWWRKTGGSTKWNSGHSVIAADDIVKNSSGEYELKVLGAHWTNTSNPNTPYEKTQNLTGFKVFAARYTVAAAVTAPAATISVQSRATDVAAELLAYYNTYAEMPITHGSSTITVRVPYHMNTTDDGGNATKWKKVGEQNRADDNMNPFLKNYSSDCRIGKGRADDLRELLQGAVDAGHVQTPITQAILRAWLSSSPYSDPAGQDGYGISCDCSGFVSYAYQHLFEHFSLPHENFKRKPSGTFRPKKKFNDVVFVEVSKPEDLRPGDAIGMIGHVRMIQDVNITSTHVEFYSIEITAKKNHADYSDGSGALGRLFRYPLGCSFKWSSHSKPRVICKDSSGSSQSREEKVNGSWTTSSDKIYGYSRYPPLYDATTSTSSLNTNPKRAYYAVAGWDEDEAGLRAAKTWRDEIMATSSYDESSTYFPEPFVANSVESFRNYWSVMKDTEIIVKEVRVFLPPVDNWFADQIPDGLEFGSSSGFEVMSESELANLGKLQWDSEGLLHIIGNHTGDISDSRPWCPAQLFANSQQIKVYGEPHEVAFSEEEDEYDWIDNWWS